MFAFVIATLSGCSQQASDNNSDPRVWNEPSIEWSTFTFRNGGWDFNIQKVLFSETETTVYMRVRGYKGRSYTFGAGTFLRADGKSYKMLSLDGLTPGQYKPMNSTNIDNIVFHFEPMPLGIKSFDMVEHETSPGAFNIYGIHRFDPKSTALKDSNWRNLRTGDWTISFMKDYVIYDCKVWKYETQLKDSTASAQTITISNDGSKATVQIGALKGGKRTIRVQAPDATKQFSCAAFDSRKLPDYPRVGRHATKLTDYGYEKTDSVTVCGILIGPNRANTTFTIDVIDPIGGTNPAFPFDTDENGFFTVKFPLVNVSYAVVRHRGNASGFNMPVEPGCTYFVYNDINTDREYVMGTKSRLQNETVKFNNEINARYDRIEESAFSSDMDAYLDYLIEQRSKHFAMLDSLRTVHPSLSDAYIDMVRVAATTDLYQMIGQARFHNEKNMYVITERMTDFILKDMKVNSIKPYSLYYDFNYFLLDFIQNLYQQSERTMTASLSQIINYAIEDKAVSLTPDQMEAVKWYGKFNDDIRDIAQKYADDMKRLNDTIETILTVEGIQEKIENATQIANETGLMEYVNKCSDRIILDNEFKCIVSALDTLGFEKRLSDIMLTHYMVEHIKSTRHSIPAAFLARFDSIVTYKPCKDAVHSQNDKYLALENVDIASLGSVVSNEEIAAMSDGQLILRKLTEPYRGKIVYIDVWGSWCHPCLENLQHANELKEQLKDFDIVYLYLANSTSDDAWKGVIKEYNLTGENCVHYNLPAKQQTLIENYLGVTGYPTYRLLNRNGALLDVNCNPRNVTELINTLKKL